ncbi:co-chaperone DjlA [Simiduia agarivorans]|uniref:Co-chaperone protein DjlA n=1 Tax=Simiduia agarivorans (strain DSM 21679 / JCM 13881 / BCRC 17597 / SA1) TaxID=1117647 RepID=K4KK09_SIMAS|nr:co-chaperone DjlA [Simiduia agarivorans]AFU98565.1 Dna-J like membrane chaperone protein [Simiduia agarivorans SA1 = DSM 21679]
MIGKIVGGLLGFFTLGPLGLILGAFAGHFFDKGLRQVGYGLTPEQKQELQNRFINTLFPLLGHIAKADGVITKDEIDHAETLMVRYGMTAERRDQAISLFKIGSEPIFTPAAVVQEFHRATQLQPDLRRVLLQYLIGIAMADGELHPGEESALRSIAEGLGYGGAMFEQLMSMLRAQDSFRDQRQRPPAADELATAYRALGVQASATDAELKKAYRKLMSENHPDKLMGQGVPEDMIKMATERAQEVQRAYDLIRKHRKG